MKLSIAPSRLISEVQQEFNKEFPFLKLEFFKYGKNKMPESGIHQIIPPNRRIGDCQLTMAEGVIEITANMKVRDLEKIFRDQYSLNVQVFRQSGNLWLQTTVTDDWTLQNQNTHGREISLSHRVRPQREEVDRDTAA